jgi:DNA polymerase-1
LPGLSPDATATLVTSLDELLDLKVWLGQRRDWLGCDIETTGLNLGRDRNRLFQVGDETHGWALEWDGWSAAIKDLMPHYDGKIVFHNASFDLAMLKRDGLVFDERLVHDTMIMAHHDDPRRAIGLKPLSARHIGAEALLGKDDLSAAMASGGWDWATIPIDHPAYWQYSCLDTMLTAPLAGILWDKIAPYRKVYEVEMGCIHVLVNARLAGLHVDLDYVNQTRSQLMVDLDGLRTRIPVDPGKDRQVKDLLMRLGQDQGRGLSLAEWWPFRTDSGDVSIDDDALAAFESDFPDLIPPLREYRTKSRVVSSYLNNFLKMNVDGVLRCNIKQVGARHGRMSITEPALQTLPRGRLVRDAVVAPEGFKLVLADYSQAEARVFASYAGCTPMIESFQRDEDQHTWVAALCYYHDDSPAALAQVTKHQRQIAKNVGYANIYGAGDATIAKTAGVALPEIEDFKSRYDTMFPEIEAFKQKIMATVHQRIREEGDGYIHTILGRRVPVDREKPFTAMNYLASGSATGDVLKLKLLELDASGLGEFIRLPVHDEIIMQVPDEAIDDTLEVIERVMPETRLFAAPLAIETDVCARWGEHYEEDPTKRGHWINGAWQE